MPSLPSMPRRPALALIPAAGRSRRMGRSKLLLPWEGSTVLGSLLASLRAAGVEDLAVVAGPHNLAALREALGEALGEALREASSEATERPSDEGHAPGGVRLILNPAPKRGMLSSLWVGLAALGGVTAWAGSPRTLLVCPADLPALAAATVLGLRRAHEETDAALVVPTYRGRRGHPLLVAPRLVPEILTLDPGRGLRQLLEDRSDDVLEVPVGDPGSVRDLDTPEDYRRLREGLEED